MRLSAYGFLSPSLWVMGLGFVIFGPIMALGPRWVPGAIVYATLAMLPLLFQNREGAAHILTSQTTALVLLAVVYSCLSAIWSPSPHATIAAIDLGYLSFCALLLTAELTPIPPETKRLYLFVFSLSLLAGFVVLAEEFLLDHPIHRWFNALSPYDLLSENVTKRVVALFSLMLWPLAAWLERVRGRVWSVAIVSGFLAFALIVTNRSAALGMLVGTAVMALAYFIPKLMRGLLILGIVCGLVFTVPAFLLTSHLPAYTHGTFFNSAQYRFKIWYYLAREVKNAPIFGHGIDATRDMKITVGPEGLPFLKPGSYPVALHPHNIFLQLWLDFGAVGVILWGGLMLMLARSLRFLEPTLQPYALGGAFCSLTMLCTTFSIQQAWWLSAHIAAAMLFMMEAQIRSSSAGIRGASAGGIG